MVDKKDDFDTNDSEKDFCNKNKYLISFTVKDLNEKIDRNNLAYKCNSREINFSNIADTIGFFNKRKNSKITLAKTNQYQRNIEGSRKN